MNPRDPYGAANLLIKCFGIDAKSHAMQRAVELQSVGDEEGQWAWLGVFGAILDIQSTLPAEGQRVH